MSSYKKIKNSIIAIVGSIAILASSALPAFAAANQPLNFAPTANETKVMSESNYNISALNLLTDEYTTKTLSNGNIEITIKDPAKFLKSQKISIPKDAKNVRVVVQMNSQEGNTNAIKGKVSTVTPNSVFQEIDAYGSPFTATNYNKLLCQANGSSGSITASVSQSVQATYTCGVTVKVSAVTAAVGFNVATGYTVTASETVPTNGVYTHLRGYEFDKVQAFEVVNWITGHTDAIGYAYQPIGCTFVSYN